MQGGLHKRTAGGRAHSRDQQVRLLWVIPTQPAQVEMKVEAIHVISRADALPFEVIDASRSDEEVAAAAARGELMVTVNRDTRLDSRPVDLRTPANQAVFQIQSGVCQARPAP